MFRKPVAFLVTLVSAMLIGNVAWAAAAPPSPETLTLDQSLRLAYQSSQAIQTAAKNVEIAQAAVNEAKAGYFPSLTYQYTYTQLDKTAPGSLVGINSSTSTGIYSPSYNNSNSGGLTLSQPLYTGGKLNDTLKIRQLSLESAQEAERKTKETLTFNVKQAYYQCWVAGQMLLVAQNSYDNLSRHVDQVNAFFKVGTVSKYDLLKAQVQRDSLKPQVVSAQNGVALAKLGLATLIGKDKNQPFEVKIDLAQMQIPDQNKLEFKATLDQAYQSRSELRQIKQAAAINKLTTDLNVANYKPNVVLSANYAGKDINNAVPNNWGLTLNLVMTGTIWNGGATQAKVAQAKGAEDLTAIQESALRDQIRTEVETALQGLTQGIETTKANQANIDLAKEGLRMAQARYNSGMGTTMDIMDAELALDQALNGYYTGVSNYLSAVAKLDLVVANDKFAELTQTTK